MLDASSPPTAEPLKAGQKFTPGRLRVWFNGCRIPLVIALLLVTIGCDLPVSRGNTPQQSSQAAICNVPLFEQVRFSTAQQDGTVLYASYATDTSFTQVGVVALNPLTQQPLWQHPFSVNANAAMRLTAADGIVYALFQRTNTDWSWLFALDAHTGQQLWAYDEEGADDMVVCNGVLALVGNWSMHIFESKTGKALWTYGLPAQNERLGSTLSITTDTLYVLGISLDQNQQVTVHALGLQDGKARWQMPLQNEQGSVFMKESLTLTEQALYVLQSSLEDPGSLVALRPQDGKQIWSASSGPAEKILMASNQTLYLASIWQIEAFQTARGKHLWSQHFELTANIVIGSSQHGLFISQNANTFCSLDLTKGTARWCLNLALLEWAGTPFFIDSNTIYLFSDRNHAHPDDNHDLYVVDPKTGKVRTHFQIHILTGAITAL